MGGPQQVGSATFTPSTLNNYEGTLSYTVSGVGTVTKAVTRLTLTPILLSANYVGGHSGSYTGCTAAASNKTYQDFFNLSVSQSGMNVTLSFTYQVPPAAHLFARGHNGAEWLDLPHRECHLSVFGRPQHQRVDLRLARDTLGYRRAVRRAHGGRGCRETANFGGTLH
jgi:hypothetical protein